VWPWLTQSLRGAQIPAEKWLRLSFGSCRSPFGGVLGQGEATESLVERQWQLQEHVQGPPPPIFSDVWQMQDFKFNVFGCVASKGVMGAFCGCVVMIELASIFVVGEQWVASGTGELWALKRIAERE
jgi:hypothetical protein